MLTVNELFSGIGAIRQALIALDVPHEVVGISEIDKYAIQSYEAIYGKTRNYGDISKVDKLDYADMWFYGFPCTDISVAGLGKGIIEGQTRSGLLYEVKRLLQVAKDNNELPKYLILENVKNLVSKKYKPQFDEWIDWLDDLNYVTHWKVLNAKDYGIPQNRERVFAISIRKDLNTKYDFPEPIVLKYRLKDILEDEVDEKYYLSERFIKGVSTLKTNGCIKVGNTTPSGKSQCNQVFDENGVHPTLCAGTHGNCNSSVLVRMPLKRGYSVNVEAEQDDTEEIDVVGNYSKSNYNATPIIRKNGIAPTVRENHGQVTAIPVKIREVGKLYPNRHSSTANSILDTEGNRQPKIVVPEVKQIANVMPTKTRDNPNQGRVYDTEGISPSLTTMGGGNREPFIVAQRGRGEGWKQTLEPNYTGTTNTITSVRKDNYVVMPEKTKKGYTEPYEGDGVYINRPHQKRGVVQHQKIQTLSTCPQNDVGVVTNNLRIRKLTPRECWRLQGFPDSAFDKAEKVCSNTQLYKQSGNSIYTGCLIAIIYSLRFGKTEGWDKYLIWKGEN